MKTRGQLGPWNEVTGFEGLGNDLGFDLDNDFDNDFDLDFDLDVDRPELAFTSRLDFGGGGG